MSSVAALRTKGTEPQARTLPHNEEAEAAVIGAMLLARQAVLDAAELLSAADFYRPRYGTIFNAIVAVENRGDPPDLVTVADELRRTQMLEFAGGETELVRLQATTPSTSSAQYAKIVAEHSQLRRLIAASNEISESAYGTPTDVAGLIDVAQQRFFDAVTDTRRVAVQPLTSVLSAGLDRIEALYNSGGSLLGVPTGWHDLDRILLGLTPGSLYTIGARPAMGKSAFALNLAAHAAIAENVPTLFVSLEMSEAELTQRLLASEAKVDSTKLRSGKLDTTDWPKITNAIGRIAQAPLQFLCSSNVSLMELRSRARQMRARGELELLIVDYLQLMDATTAENRHLQIAELTRGLKKLAGELAIPIVILSQLNRGVEQRQEKRPSLSDLKESGSIEQDSDVVIFLYRDEIYNPESVDRGIAEIIIAKHRQGPTGNVRVVFLDHYSKFANFASAPHSPTPTPTTAPSRPNLGNLHLVDPDDPNLNN
jgi:replicative DNA helicase